VVGLALARATGHPFLGVPTKPGATLVLSAEDSMTDYLRKVDAWRTLYPNLDADAVARNVSIWEFVGEDFRIVGNRFGEVTANASRVDEIVMGVLSLDPRPDLIVIETASRFGAGDENANGAAAALVAACERLAEMTGAAILLLTHVGKAAARSATVDAYAPRGASALTDNARSVLILSDIPKGKDAASRQSQERILGRPLDDGEDLLVLAAGKSNFAPRAGHVVMERIATPFGLCMKSIGGSRGPSAQSEAEFKATVARVAVEAKSTRLTTGAHLREVVAALATEGHTVTAKKLKDQWATQTGLPARQIGEAVEDAITDGFLEETKSGRGKACLSAKFDNSTPETPSHPGQSGTIRDSTPPMPGPSSGTEGSYVYGEAKVVPDRTPGDHSGISIESKKGLSRIVPDPDSSVKSGGKLISGINGSSFERIPWNSSDGHPGQPVPDAVPDGEMPEIDPSIFGD